MNSDNFKGTAKKVEGSIESTYGNVTGNNTAEVRGESKKLMGQAQNAFGKAEDKVLDIAGKVRGFISTASDDISSATTRVNSEIHEKPVRSSVIALAVGFLLGKLLSR